MNLVWLAQKHIICNTIHIHYMHINITVTAFKLYDSVVQNQSLNW